MGPGGDGVGAAASLAGRRRAAARSFTGEP